MILLFTNSVHMRWRKGKREKAQRAEGKEERERKVWNVFKIPTFVERLCLSPSTLPLCMQTH